MKTSSQSGKLAAAKSAKSKMCHFRQLAAAKSAKSKRCNFRQLAAAKSAKPKRRHSGKLAAAKSAKSTDVDLLVGDVAEADHQHCARHATYDGQGMQNCLRCVAIRRRQEIAQVAPWAASRPCHLGGAWRMGCRICAAGRWEEEVQRRRRAHMKANARAEFCRQSISRCSVWGEFQFIEACDQRNF